ncbi:hypothetical protein CLV58_109227 [Spirosoma oryzae]|uniref:Gene product 88 domain-containing protein n=2 Tax=Spirosoma oryzae TaxID=1469603 RepID=A0A2T0SYK5_9BACT|nr:hypothetical protein CLV58_109227 [Spirosoma oryzae]
MELLLGKKRLLQPGSNNKKLASNDTETWILNLAPHTQNSKGKSLCGHASPSCIKACLFKAGHGKMPAVERTRRLNTEVFIHHRETFIQLLHQELWGLHLKATQEGSVIAVRTNGTSDIDFYQLILNQTGVDVLKEYTGLVAYDYTKDYKKWEKYRGTPYHLTFSRSEINWLQARWVLEQGGNTAVVFYPKVPKTWQGFPVHDGSFSDERWLDPPGYIIGLIYKKVPGDDPLTNPFVVKV